MRLRLLIAAVLALVALVAAGSASAVTTYVTSGDIGSSWSTADTRAGGSVAIDGTYGAPSGFGSSSIHFTTTDTAGGSGQAKAQLVSYGYVGTPLSEISALGYWAYRDSTSTNSAAQTVGLNIEVDYVGDGSSYTTLVYEPVYQAGGGGAMLTDTWQHWDAYDGGNAKWWSTKNIPGVCAFNCFVSWSTILADNPKAKIVGLLGFNLGSGWVGNFSGAADGLTINSTTYDFESQAPCTATCYVNAATGSDSNGGATPAQAKKTIQAAVDQVSSGGTVIVAAGSYPENVSIAKDVTLDGAQATVDARGRSASESNIDPTSGSGVNLKGGSAGSTIDGFTFSGPGKQLQSTSGPIDGITVEDNRFVVQASGVGMFLNDKGTDVTIDQNSFDGGGTSSTLLHLDTDPFDGIWITNNWLKNSGGTGLFSDGARNVNPSGDRSPKLEGNLFDSNETGANLGRKSWSDASITGNTFTNNLLGLQGGMASSTIGGNTFDGNGLWGLELTGFGNSADATRGAQYDLIKNNTFTNNGNAPDGYGSLGPAAIFYSSGQYPGTISTNVAEKNNITGNAAGVVYSGSETINVECNWWGSYTGPSGDGPGSGDSIVGSTFDYSPWLTNPAPDGACNGPLAPMQLKQRVADDLSALLPTGDKKTDKAINDAVKHLNRSLDSKLWSDPSHLDPKHGKKVFDEEKAAVKALTRVKSPPAEFADAIDQLVSVDQGLAQGAIDDAQAALTGASGNQHELDAAQKEIAKATDEMAKAQDSLDKGKPDDAIDHYKKAWDHAQKALQHINKAADH